jgi:hypothetical protein
MAEYLMAIGRLNTVRYDAERSSENKVIGHQLLVQVVL